MRIAAVILAAGSGTRMGGVAKALLKRGDRTFLQCIAAHVSEGVVVVGPPFGDAVAAHARELQLRVVVNEDPSRGMASSVALGFASLEADAAWLWPVDHPDVQGATLETLSDAIGAHDVAVPTYQGRGGHPPLVKRALFGKLAACTNARDVIGTADAIRVEIDDRGTVLDVDR